MSSSSQAIGLLGGTFDPIHVGHLHLAQVVYTALQLREIRFIPNYKPLLRDPPIASVQDRVSMIQLAIKNHPQFTLDTRELEHTGYSYTIDTLKSIRSAMKDIPLCFIMSMDQFVQFTKWREWKNIPNFAHLIIATREGYKFDVEPALMEVVKEREIKDKNALHTTPAGFIYFLDIKPIAISGTLLRQQIKEGDGSKQFLPAAVWNYICKKNLYR